MRDTNAELQQAAEVERERCAAACEKLLKPEADAESSGEAWFWNRAVVACMDAIRQTPCK